MHELSVAQSLIDLLTDQIAQQPPGRVGTVRVAVGQLSGVVPQALATAFHTAIEGTLFEGATLVIDEIPPAVWCTSCNAERDAVSIQSLRCAVCNTPSSDIRRGRELEVISMEVFEES